ncbi:unnamed protein product [Ixodes pacificus]
METHEPGIDHFFDIWHISKNSQAYSQFKSITGDKRLPKDFAQMSPHGQTYALEAFHSVLIDFAPKSKAFSPEGTLAKT